MVCKMETFRTKPRISRIAPSTIIDVPLIALVMATSDDRDYPNESWLNTGSGVSRTQAGSLDVVRWA
jgi:hypothetical protein